MAFFLEQTVECLQCKYIFINKLLQIWFYLEWFNIMISEKKSGRLAQSVGLIHIRPQWPEFDSHFD